MALKKNALVIVTWSDAFLLNDDEHTDSSQRPPAAIEESVGFVVRDDRAEKKEPALMIAMSRHTGEDDGMVERHKYRDRLVLPLGTIRKVRVLKAP